MATFANPDFYDNSPARQSFAFHSVVRGRPDPEGAPANLPLLGEAIIGFQILARDDSATVQRLGAGPDMRWLAGITIEGEIVAKRRHEGGEQMKRDKAEPGNRMKSAVMSVDWKGNLTAK